MTWLILIVAILVLGGLAVWATGMAPKGVDPNAVRTNKYKARGKGDLYNM